MTHLPGTRPWCPVGELGLAGSPGVLKGHWGEYVPGVCFLFFVFFVFLHFLGLLPRHMEVPRLGVESYGASQARGLIRAVAASLHESHSNSGSEPHLQPTP